MFGIFANLIERPTIRYLLAFLLGATLGASGGHAILAGILHGFSQLFGLNGIHTPSIHG